MSMLFQDSKPFPFSVEKNLTYAMEFYEKNIRHKKQRIETLLKSVNLYDELNVCRILLECDIFIFTDVLYDKSAVNFNGVLKRGIFHL